MLKKRPHLLFLLIFSALIFPKMVFAQDTTGQICGVGAATPGEFASRIFGCGISLVGGVALLFIIYGGFVLLTSSGNPNKVRIGKEYITYAVVGLVLAILTFIVLEVTGSDILHIPGFGT